MERMSKDTRGRIGELKSVLEDGSHLHSLRKDAQRHGLNLDEALQPIAEDNFLYERATSPGDSTAPGDLARMVKEQIRSAVTSKDGSRRR